ncbi:hypothetical protein M8C21_013431, partial [Ambrosia artemisiifolia]
MIPSLKRLQFEIHVKPEDTRFYALDFYSIRFRPSWICGAGIVEIVM